MSKQGLERIAVASGVLIVLAAAWFWALQVGDVIELLEMAYGE